MGNAMMRVGAALLVFSALAFPQGAMAQGSPPLKATLFFKNPPPGNPPAFSATTPIPIILQIQNVSGSPIITTDKFSSSDFFRQLFFTLPGGGILTNPAFQLHATAKVFYCLSLGGVLQSPAIPVVPIEVLAGPTPPPGPPNPFFLEYSIPDARTFYNDLTEPGLYTAKAVIPLLTFDPAAVIHNCDQFTGDVVNVGLGGGGTEFTIVSNNVEFLICCFTFVGFAPPVGTAVDPSIVCSTTPAVTRNFGDTVPLKFQLFLNNAVVKTAVAFVSAQQCGGQPVQKDLGQGSVPTNQFRFDPTGNQYVFNLDTSVLAPGIWQINASISDGSVHSVLIQLR